MTVIRMLGVLCVFAFPAFAQEAPLGLHWGVSVEQIVGAGFSGNVLKDDGRVSILLAKIVPGAPEGTDGVRLIVHKTFGLQRMVWISKTFLDDPTGRKGVDLFHTKKDELANQYGKPKSTTEEFGLSTYRRPEYFYQCLATDGCGMYAIIWRTAYTDVVLHLIGTDQGTGWLEITYSGPDWPDVLAEARKRPASGISSDPLAASTQDKRPPDK